MKESSDTMQIFVYGGAASGKSEYAEQLAVKIAKKANAPLVYLATLYAHDAESQQRIARHQQQRAAQHFLTVEAPFAIDKLTLPPDSVVLLECLSTLLANELFLRKNNTYNSAALLQNISALEKNCHACILVSNSVFSDGTTYDPQTTHYLTELGFLHQAICHTADQIYEVVCGIPIQYRKEKC